MPTKLAPAPTARCRSDCPKATGWTGTGRYPNRTRGVSGREERLDRDRSDTRTAQAIDVGLPLGGDNWSGDQVPVAIHRDRHHRLEFHRHHVAPLACPDVLVVVELERHGHKLGDGICKLGGNVVGVGLRAVCLWHRGVGRNILGSACRTREDEQQAPQARRRDKAKEGRPVAPRRWLDMLVPQLGIAGTCNSPS